MSDAGKNAASAIVLICPSCRQPRTQRQIVLFERQYTSELIWGKEQRLARQAFEEWLANLQADINRRLEQISEQQDYYLKNPRGAWWACDFCLANGDAIAADPQKQYTKSMFIGFFAYFDQKFVCEDCRRETVFTKAEQLFWYETLKFIQCSRPKRCRTCRAARRARNLPKTKDAK